MANICVSLANTLPELGREWLPTLLPNLEDRRWGAKAALDISWAFLVCEVDLPLATEAHLLQDLEDPGFELGSLSSTLKTRDLEQYCEIRRLSGTPSLLETQLSLDLVRSEVNNF